MRLRKGDRVIAHVGGKTGPAIVLEDQAGETVRFQWENGQMPTIESLERVAKALGVKPGELL